MLKKSLLVLTGFVLAIAVFGVAGFAYAQVQTPPNPEYPCPYCETTDGYVGRGRGMHGGGFGSGMMSYAGDTEYGPMHETMLTALSEVLGLSVEELETRHDAGETMWQIAESQGYSLEDFTALMFSARSAALDQAVADGLLTQEQADWMQSRWEYMQANGYGPGSAMGTGPCHGGSFENSRGGRGGDRWSGNQ